MGSDSDEDEDEDDDDDDEWGGGGGGGGPSIVHRKIFGDVKVNVNKKDVSRTQVHTCMHVRCVV